MSLKEVQNQIKAKRDALATVLAEAKIGTGDELRYDHTKVKAQQFESGSQMAEFIATESKGLEDLEADVQVQQSAKAAEDRNRQAINAGVKLPEFPADAEPETYEAPKSLGELFVEKFYDENGEMRRDVAKNTDHDLPMPVKGGGSIEQILKTDMETGAGWAPESLRIGRVQMSAVRTGGNVADLFPVIPTQQAAVVYMLESTYTATNTIETAENAAIGEAALALTATTATVRKIAGTLPVTQEQLDDVPQVRAYIDQRMRNQLLNRIDQQLLTGAGTGVLWEGLENVTGIQSVALSNEIPETIHQVITDIRTNAFDEPDDIVLAPAEWDQVVTLKAADGTYIYGHPAMAANTTMWGKPVTVTTAGTASTGYVGCFATQSALFMRSGVQVSITDSHASEFLDDVIRLKFTIRGVPVFFRPEAFGEATGI